MYTPRKPIMPRVALAILNVVGLGIVVCLWLFLKLFELASNLQKEK